MLSRIRPRLTYANVMSSIAVFVVLGGGAYATHTHRIGTADIQKRAVTTPKLDRQAVGTGKLKPQAVGTGRVKPQAIGPGKLKEPAVGAAKIFDGAVFTDKLANGAVTSPKLGNIVQRTDTTEVADGASGTANATCLEGERLLSGGGGFLAGETLGGVTFSGQAGPIGNWRVHAHNASGAPRTLEAQVHCLQ